MPLLDPFLERDASCGAPGPASASERIPSRERRFSRNRSRNLVPGQRRPAKACVRGNWTHWRSDPSCRSKKGRCSPRPGQLRVVSGPT